MISANIHLASDVLGARTTVVTAGIVMLGATTIVCVKKRIFEAFGQ